MTEELMRILVVDDDATARLRMRSALEKAGFEVTLAGDGEEALRLFGASPCDMLLLDVDMPGMNGYEVCAHLRREVGHELPIVMVTGMDDVKSIERAYAAGATDFIAKPINWDLIGHRVSHLRRAYLTLLDLHNANAHNAAILSAIPDIMFRLGEDGMVLETRNDSKKGAPLHPQPGHPLGETFPPEVVATYLDAAQRARMLGRVEHVEYQLSQTDGTIRYFEGRIVVIAPRETLCLARDITERKLQELQVITAQHKLQATLDAIPDLMFELDSDGRYLDYHSPRSDLLAAPAETFLGKTVAEILPADAAQICMSALREAHEKGLSTGKQFELQLARGKFWFELSVSRKTTDCTQKAHFIVLSRDITERKQAEKAIFRLAYFDTLTGLPNRQSFTERLNREILRAKFQGSKLAILFLDLDGFKNVNDTMGHGTGDLLLQWVADRLHQGMRPSDLVARNDDVEVESNLARLGGDEFTVIIPNMTDSRDAVAVAHRIREVVRRPFSLEGRDVVLTASIGVAIYPDDGADAAALLKHADTAMYHAKDEGRDNYKLYSASLTQQAVQRLNLESGLRQALDHDELFLVYQPQVDLGTGRIASVEALIRWNHPEQGLISPMDFIPLAEETGLIVPIGEWVLRNACAEASRWCRQGLPTRIAVNLSAIQFKNPNLALTVSTILAEIGLAPEWLELEVTEGALMEDTHATLITLNALREGGIRLALDDFGTGYSSMSYLKRLPLNSLKVDRSFVRGLPDDHDSLAIVRAVVSLAKNLGFSVTAEGVETIEQARILGGLSCEVLQGYYFSKPVAAGDIPALLDKQWSIEGPLRRPFVNLPVHQRRSW